ncbi:MAG: hypothetical protein AB1422_03995 [bacterium]
MNTLTYDNLIDTVKSLSIEEKEELKFLMERYLIEERREEIYKNYQNSLKEAEKGKLEFSSNVRKLRKMVEK